MTAAAAAGGAWLWVAHPAVREAEIEKADHKGLTPGQVAAGRDAEWRMLSDPQLAETCRTHGIRAIRVTDL